MTAKRMVLPLLGLAIVAAVISSLFSGDESTPRRSTDPLEQASVAFEGSPSRSEVKRQMDRALTMLGLESSDSNYSRAGSVLVTMRKSAFERGCTQCTEMAILNHMLRSRGDLIGMTFSEAAAWSTEAMMAGDR